MLSKKKRYLQIALNSTLEEAKQIISQLPVSDRIIIEAGTPFLKSYGIGGLKAVKEWWTKRWLLSPEGTIQEKITISALGKALRGEKVPLIPTPYVVADLKAMDRGETEVRIAKQGGANAITVLGEAPIETIDTLIAACETTGLDAIIDMMNVEKPYQVLRKLKTLPPVVMLHRGVDETEMGEKPLPIHLINKVKGAFDVMICIGGGDTTREVQRAIFNGADIVMVWKEFYHSSTHTRELAEAFLKEIK